MGDGCVIGVDLGGTKLLAGAVDARLDVHHRTQRPAPRGSARAVLDAVCASVLEAAEASGRELEAVGLGIPSLIDQTRGVAVHTVHLPLQDVAVRDVLAERLGVPVFVDNDGNCAMLAEHGHGAARGADHAELLTLGTGIGGGLVVGGRLVRGALGAAGEIGHMTVERDGPPCPGNCPNHGCLEAVASGPALGRLAVEAAADAPETGLARALAQGREATGALVTELAHDGDEAARGCLERMGRGLGVGIASLVNLLNPDVVVVGGGVIGAGELLLAPARAELARRALSPSKEHVRVVPARFGAEAGMLGAAALALAGLAGDPPEAGLRGAVRP